MIIPGAEPFFFRGGPVGALLLHGFTSTPREMRPVGEQLATAGLTVLGLRFPQHGTRPEDLFHGHRYDWCAAALDGYALLKDQCAAVFVMGLSMGGVVALWLAAQKPVLGVVTLSTPSMPMYRQINWRVLLAPWLAYILPQIAKRKRNATLEADHISYPGYPTRALPEFHRLLRETDAVLPQVMCPALLIHSRQDTGVPPENQAYLQERLGSPHKEVVWLERSDHIITKDCEKDVVLAHIQRFVQRWQPAAVSS